jgi:hypothetical protein
MLSSFRLAQYRLTLEALDPLHLPPFKGSALRGGFGYTFKRLVCFQSKPCGKRCELGNACPYGYIFETAPPEGTEVLSKNAYVPRPFVIEPPDDPRTLIPSGERLSFGLTLVGRGINYLPYFIAVFRELGRAGLGRSRGKYRLLAMDAVSPLDGATAPVYRSQDDTIRTANLAVSGDAITTHATTLPADRLHLRFLTPTRLIYRKKPVQDPPFHVLVRRLLDRVSSLSYFHCGQRWETDFKGLIEQAKAVRLAECDTRWENVERYSGRQKARLSLGGFVGDVVYEGDVAPFRSLLLLGSLVHVGKGTVFGNGKYGVGSRE